ncbi:MAG: gliding motility protein GldN [Dysgonamonadaceae bacterium]|jgi:gliding motility associated protien GldN|nr:gliding motility protein GldN [Dysgonamonadaceae bacterium]
MRPIYFFSLLFIFFAFASAGFAQAPDKQQIRRQIEEQRRLQAERNQSRQNQSGEVQEQPQQPVPQQEPDAVRRTRQRPSEVIPDKTVPLTERARIKNLDNSRVPTHTVWLREIFKIIDLDKGENAALRYPVQPMGDRVNLFTLLFRLMSDNRIDAYKYIADREAVFTEEERVSFEEVLKSNLIPYTVEGTGANAKFIIDETDIPSQDVSKYLIKEGWFFDEATGSFNSRVTAICPVMVRMDYNDGTTQTNPICWISYESIRPYLSRTLIMTSDYNNALTYTIDDYFMKKMYSGDIIKTVNMKNQTLAQQVGNEPEALKHAQDSIENQLKFFEKQLWVQEDTTTLATNKKESKSATKSVRSRGSSNQDASKAAKTEEKKQPKPKAEKSSSTPTRSVRRTR